MDHRGTGNSFIYVYIYVYIDICVCMQIYILLLGLVILFPLWNFLYSTLVLKSSPCHHIVLLAVASHNADLKAVIK